MDFEFFVCCLSLLDSYIARFLYFVLWLLFFTVCFVFSLLYDDDFIINRFFNFCAKLLLYGIARTLYENLFK